MSSMRLPSRLPFAAAALLAATFAHAQGTPSRGQLLYATHCAECHTSQMHWRDRLQAQDWESLKAWVRRWQDDARLRWSEDDVEAVARHLNETFYHFPRRHAAR